MRITYKDLDVIIFIKFNMIKNSNKLSAIYYFEAVVDNMCKS